jgi:hypothetical protein
MELLELEQHRLVLERANLLIQVAFDSDKEYLKTMISNSKTIIDNFNKENLTVLDVDVVEDGKWRGAVKIMVRSEYARPIVKEMEYKRPHYKEEDSFCKEHYQYDEIYKGFFWEEEQYCEKCKLELKRQKKESESYYSKIHKVEREFYVACDNTVFEEDLRLKYILFKRQIKNKHKLTPLETTLNKTLRNEIIKTFQNQNKELITKYL